MYSFWHILLFIVEFMSVGIKFIIFSTILLQEEEEGQVAAIGKSSK